MNEDGRLDAMIARAENGGCRDCEVGEPHVCPDLRDVNEDVETLAEVLARHGIWKHGSLADDLAPLLAKARREGRAETEDAIFEPITSRLVGRDAAPVTASNLRYAATHEALSRSWIFDVLIGLADYLDPASPDTESDQR